MQRCADHAGLRVLGVGKTGIGGVLAAGLGALDRGRDLGYGVDVGLKDKRLQEEREQCREHRPEPVRTLAARRLMLTMLLHPAGMLYCNATGRQPPAARLRRIGPNSLQATRRPL